MVYPGIRLNDCYFTEPTRLQNWRPSPCAGLFVILARDSSWGPKPFRPLYFGEFGNHAQGSLLPPRELLKGEALYVAMLPLPFSTAAQRTALRHELIRGYNPAFQTNGPATVTELAHKLEEIEVRQQEQNTLTLHLLANLNKLFEPQPVPPRRPIGFLPQIAAAAQADATEAGS